MIEKSTGVYANIQDLIILNENTVKNYLNAMDNEEEREDTVEWFKGASSYSSDIGIRKGFLTVSRNNVELGLPLRKVSEITQVSAEILLKLIG